MHPELRRRIEEQKAKIPQHIKDGINAAYEQMKPTLTRLAAEFPTAWFDEDSRKVLLEINTGLGEAHFVRRRNHQRTFESSLDQKAYADVFIARYPDEIAFLRGIISLHEQGLIEEREIAPGRPAFVLTDAGMEAVAIVMEAERLSAEPTENPKPDPYFA